MKKIILLYVIFSFLYINVVDSFAAVWQTFDDVGRLPEMIEYSPNLNKDKFTSSYAPWIKLMHITTSEQAEKGIVGGEACQQVRSIATNEDGSITLAGTDTNGIWKSDNGGEYWYNTGGYDYRFMYIPDIMHYRNNTFYMVSSPPAGDYIQTSDDYGLYKSTDGGNSWTHVLKAYFSQDMADELIAKDGNSVYAVANDGVYKSADEQEFVKIYDYTGSQNAKSITVNNGIVVAAWADKIIEIQNNAIKEIPLPSENAIAYTVDINPVDSTYWISADASLYKYNGQSYTRMHTFSYDRHIALAKFTPDGNRYYVMYNMVNKPFRYVDVKNSQTSVVWSYPTFDIAGSFQPTYNGYFRQGFDFADNGTVYVSNGGICKSTNSGTDFVWKNSGISGMCVEYISHLNNGEMVMSVVDIGTVAAKKAYLGEFVTFERRNVDMDGIIGKLEVNPVNKNHVVSLSSDGKTIYNSTDGDKTNVPVLRNTEKQQTFILFEENRIRTNGYESVDGNVWTKIEQDFEPAGISKDKNILWKLEGNNTASELKIAACDKTKNITTQSVSVNQRSRGGNYVIPDVENNNICYVLGDFGLVKAEYNAQNEAVSTKRLFSQGSFSFAQNPDNPKHMIIGRMSDSKDKTYAAVESKDGGNTWYGIKGIYGHRSITYVKFSATTDEVFLCSTNGTLIYDYNEYAKYVHTLSFDSTGSISGSVEPVDNIIAGDGVILPENEFVNPGYEFAGWSDGSDFYQAGSEYKMPNADVVLFPIWNYTGAITLTPSSEALTEKDSSTEINSDYYLMLKGNDNRLWYEFDGALLTGSAVQKAELKINLDRNHAGNGYICIYPVTGDWDEATITAQKLPAYGENCVKYFIGSETGIMERTIDVTSIMPTVSAEDPHIRFMIFSEAPYNNGYKVYGVGNSGYSPRLEVSGASVFERIADDCQTVKLNNLEASKIRCRSTFEKTEKILCIMPVAALYNGEKLISVEFGTGKVLENGVNTVYADIDLSKETINNDYILKFFVFDSMTGLTPAKKASFLKYN